MNDIQSLLVVDAKVRDTEPPAEDEYETVLAKLLEVVEDQHPAIAERLSLASPAPIIDGKPRMLHVTAMIVHEGINRNGDEFIAEELASAVRSGNLFADGYAGFIDTDHDFQPIGYWYKSELVTDPSTGTQGILAHGAIWAYLFPETTDRILAQQTRDEHIRVSMVCISKAEDVDYRETDTGHFIKTMHNPVFVGATMLIDKPAGDQDAIGIAIEDPADANISEMRNVVLKAAAEDGNNHKLEETVMVDEMRPLLAELLGDQSEKFTDEISQLIQDQVADFQGILDTKDEALVEANSTIETLTSQNAELTTSLEEKTLSIETLQAEAEALNTKLTETEASLAEFIAEKAANDLKAVQEARFAELSEAAQARFKTKSVEIQEKLLARWAGQTEEEWETTKAELSLTTVTEKPEDNKPLPGVGTGGKTLEDLLIKKN